MTITSGSYCASVSTVSLSDSPLSTDEPAAFSDITSAESRFAASSKLDDVRVEDSKKRLSTSLPRQRRQLLVDALRARPAVSRIRSTSSRVEVADREQVPHDFSSGAPTRRIRSAPSISSSSTWIRSLRAVGRFLPT